MMGVNNTTPDHLALFILCWLYGMGGTFFKTFILSIHFRTTRIIYILHSKIRFFAEIFSQLYEQFSQYPFRKSFLFKFVAYFFLCIIYQEQQQHIPQIFQHTIFETLTSLFRLVCFIRSKCFLHLPILKSKYVRLYFLFSFHKWNLFCQCHGVYYNIW